MLRPSQTILPLFISQHLSWNSLPLFIKICLIVALLAITGIILAMLTITIRKLVLVKHARQMEALATQVNDLLLKAVVLAQTSKGSSMFRAEFDMIPFYASGLPDKKVREVIVREMLNYRSYLSGETALRIRNLYIDLSFHKEALKRLESHNWETRANALSELFKMDIEVEDDQLIELASSDNRYITELARLLLIKFSKGDPMQFLQALPLPISQWEELEIFHLLKQRNDIHVASIRTLLSTDIDHTHISLALKLAVHFQLAKVIPDVLSLMETTDLKLRAQAVAAIGKLGSAEAEKHLHLIYQHQPIEIRLAILRAMGQIRSGQSLSFLENEFLYSEDFGIKKTASDAIISQHPLSDTIINKLLENHEPLNRVILQHSMDPLINAI